MLHAFDLTERKDKTVIKGISRWWLSHEGSKILYEAKSDGGPGAYGIIDAKPDAGAKIGDGALNLSGLRLDVIRPPSGGKSTTRSGGRSVIISSRPA